MPEGFEADTLVLGEEAQPCLGTDTGLDVREDPHRIVSGSYRRKAFSFSSMGSLKVATISQITLDFNR